jgi:hypothetical protein
MEIRAVLDRTAAIQFSDYAVNFAASFSETLMLFLCYNALSAKSLKALSGGVSEFFVLRVC